MTSEPRYFNSEDDLNTFEGYLRYQAIDPTTASQEVLGGFRKVLKRRKEQKQRPRNLAA